MTDISGKKKSCLSAATQKQRIKMLKIIDRQRHEHYGDIQLDDLTSALMRKFLAFTRSEISDEEASKIFGSHFDDLKVMKAEWLKRNLHKADRAVLNHLLLNIYGIVNMNRGDKEAQLLEADAIGYELKESFDEAFGKDTVNFPGQDEVPKEVAKNAEWKKLLEEMAEDARNPMIRADICIRWQDAKKSIGARQAPELKIENFNNILNFVNKYRNPGDAISWTWQAAEKWASRHKGTINRFIREKK